MGLLIFVGMGGTYLFAEFVATIMLVTIIGGILSAIAGVAIVMGAISYMFENPLPNPEAWWKFVVGTALVGATPFVLAEIFMFHGAPLDQPVEQKGFVHGLVILAICAWIFFGWIGIIPEWYERCQRMR
jgi:hypothetical protein